MKEIQERFAADPQRMRLEQANLFKREKVNPAAGCLPMLPTLFVFWALYPHAGIVTHRDAPHAVLRPGSTTCRLPDPTSIFNLFGLIRPWNPAPFR